MTQLLEKTAFDRVLTARHPDRPYSMDLFSAIFTDFIEIHGDRRYADDAAMVCGFAKLDGTEVVVIGQQKGRDTNQRKFRNFAMPKPEGYRKALRVMKLAEKFGRPIISFIDTPGAYPGIDAEERGQAEAIAFNLREMASLKVPIIAVILGEGGSGGALAIGIGDKVLMMENSVYSVISPEGCAAILWKDSTQSDLAAAALRLTANDLKSFGLIDEVIPEPKSWEISPEDSNDPKKTAAFDGIARNLKKSLLKYVKELNGEDDRKRIIARFKKFREMGEWV
ncbi:MAG: acetyl-CoA carboxylase carboxyltransferase subunit alpha [Acidobacteriota bacterium]|jgi:acetyl-CoA carboxylase carboxyl transferase subunit alpha|nr:acetyl-CoA carboxylase carboxyltransferase subunit alpha [Blastocatellia bacterium]MDQ3220895.1 acetyl-CoA carboxylase carboxyltransferase subunit alpha [Acidobacteriota bacterium]MDQ3489660.1 acetyl-CoA carboxylase carboxyltransferase subunit alpha [Acidobacteriota bacterium]